MPRTLFLFDRPESVAAWSAIDDRVMGGVSRSALRFDPAGHAVFAGLVSADNNGGFASVRSAVVHRASGEFDPEAFDAIELDVRGDGRRYKLNLRTDHGFDGVSYQAGFEPPAGTWTHTFKTPRFAFRGWAPQEIDVTKNRVTMELAFSGAVLPNGLRLAFAHAFEVANPRPAITPYAPSLLACSLACRPIPARHAGRCFSRLATPQSPPVKVR